MRRLPIPGRHTAGCRDRDRHRVRLPLLSGRAASRTAGRAAGATVREPLPSHRTAGRAAGIDLCKPLPAERDVCQPLPSHRTAGRSTAGSVLSAPGRWGSRDPVPSCRIGGSGAMRRQTLAWCRNRLRQRG
jgi:hypothetical protein